MEDTPSWISMLCTSFENCDHGVEEELQHVMTPCPDIVRIDVSLLKTHKRLSPHFPEFSSRAVFFPSVCSLCVQLLSNGREVPSSCANVTVNAMINANTTVFIVAKKRHSFIHSFKKKKKC